MNEQQQSLLEILGHHREDVDELISTKTKKFRKPSIEKQHLFNSSMLQLLQRIKKEHKKQHFETAYNIIKEAISKLETQQSDLLIADQSKYGFLTVNLLHGNTELPSSIAKKVEKIEARLDKSHSEYGSNKKPYKNTEQRTGGRFENQRRRQGPEQLLQQLQKNKREGKCSHCEGSGHFFRECPKFWQEVSDARTSST
jgi:hypothetical protein